MQLKRKNIVILSMILLLFVVGYAYNMFTGAKYINSDISIGGEDIGIFDETTGLESTDETAAVNGDNTADVPEVSADYNPFQETSSVAILENNTNAENDDSTETIAAESANAAFFAEYRLERDKNRSKEVEMWQDIINSESSEQTFKELAQQELVKIVALTDKEMIIENLIISRGFNDALVFITDDSASVIVEAKELTQPQVAQIQDIVVRKTKLDPTAVKIMTKN